MPRPPRSTVFPKHHNYKDHMEKKFRRNHTTNKNTKWEQVKDAVEKSMARPVARNTVLAKGIRKLVDESKKDPVQNIFRRNKHPRGNQHADVPYEGKRAITVIKNLANPANPTVKIIKKPATVKISPDREHRLQTPEGDRYVKIGHYPPQPLVPRPGGKVKTRSLATIRAKAAAKGVIIP